MAAAHAPFAPAASLHTRYLSLYLSPWFQQDIRTATQSENIEWHFNSPAAPHLGGLWEAGVRSTKFHLRRVLGSAVVTYEEMSTVLARIEAVFFKIQI